MNTAPDGEPATWQTLEALSTGQKATAVLFLLLLESEAPLVVDQPEDDLDNRFITEGVVPIMRLEKRRRQFVFSTHNANIPVLGDAELILGLAASGEGREGHTENRSRTYGINRLQTCARTGRRNSRRRQRCLRDAPFQIRVLKHDDAYGIDGHHCERGKLGS